MSKSYGCKPPTYVTGTQQLLPEFWPGWDTAMILRADPTEMGGEMIRRYEAAGGQCEGFWIIKHDRDRLADGSAKPNHLHWVLAQGSGSTRDPAGRLQCVQIDAAFGFSKSIARAPGRGGRIENGQSYLIHAKDPDKFQYPVADVVTLRGRDYAEIEAEHRTAWARRAAMGRRLAVSAKEWAELGDILTQRVLDGEVDELDLLNDRTLMDIYTRNQVRVDLAFKNVARREMLMEVQRLRAGEFHKTIVWVTGATDQGKTYLVESVAQQLGELTGWKTYRAAAKNGLDKYQGEPILMINEPSTKVLEWADLLQLTGPREAGPVSARFHNKDEVAPRVILIAVSIDPAEFGFFVPGKRSTSDSVDQLVRRITLAIQARKIDDEPHYAVSLVGAVEPYEHLVYIPGGDARGNAKYERLRLDHGPASTEEGLTHDEAVDAVIDAVARRSPGVGLVSSAQRQLDEVTATLAGLGIVFAEPPVVIEGQVA